MAVRRRDPRVARATRSVNYRLLSDAVRHSIGLERLKSEEVAEIVRMLDRIVVPDLLATIEHRLRRGLSAGRARDVAGAANEVLRAGMSVVGPEVEVRMRNVAVTEAEWQAALVSRVSPIALDFTTPDVGVLRQLVAERPMEGRLLGEWFDGLAPLTSRRIERAVDVGIASGESVDDILSRIRGADAGRSYRSAFEGGTGSIGEMNRNARAVVRTAVNNVSTGAREETYKGNEDLIDGVQIVATLDLRTTEICMGLDGQVFPVDEGPRPPFHWNCRTTTIPVLKSWMDLGIPLADTTSGTRASMDGQVPDRITYDDWLRGRSAEEQDEALGPVRGALFRAGEVDAGSFTSRDGDRLTLAELVRSEGLDADRVILLVERAGGPVPPDLLALRTRTS